MTIAKLIADLKAATASPTLETSAAERAELSEVLDALR